MSKNSAKEFISEKKAPSVSNERLRELSLFEKSQNLSFNDITLLNLAFTHSSFANERKGIDDNERFEFLGDSVLDMITAEYIFENYYARHDEGDFSKIKAIVVSEDSLSEVALEMKFENYLLVGHGESNQGGAWKKAIQADALEAVIAAIYLDKGLEEARKFVLSFIPQQIEKVLKNKVSYKDYKTKLQEYCQKHNGKVPLYNLEKQEGSDHAQTFWMSVTVENIKYGPESGKNKKNAEQNVARLALIHLGLEPKI